MNQWDQRMARQAPRSRVGGFAGAPVCKWLLIALLVLFIVDIAGAKESIGNLKPWLALSAGTAVEVWRWITYPFVNVAFGGWIFSLLIIFSLGRLLEQSLGSRRFSVFLIYCTLLGALTFSIMGSSSPKLFTGAAGICLGLLTATATLYPELTIQLLIPPIPLKMKTLAMIVVGLFIGMTIGYRHDPAVSLGHLSAVAVGYFCMKKMTLLDFMKPQTAQQKRASKRAPKRAAQRPRKRPQPKKKVGMKPRTEIKLSESRHEAEVNRILDKVSSEGIGNLTDEEKEILKFAAKDD